MHRIFRSASTLARLLGVATALAALPLSGPWRRGPVRVLSRRLHTVYDIVAAAGHPGGAPRDAVAVSQAREGLQSGRVDSDRGAAGQ
jgi:hypothetical protein